MPANQKPLGYYFHAPGQLTRWGVVDVGLRCFSKCQTCFYMNLTDHADPFHGMRHAEFHSLEAVKEQISGLAEHGFLGFDITGGEPTLFPGIVEAIAYATQLGLSSRIITLGQLLLRKDLLERLLDAGLTDFRFSFHSDDPDEFHRYTSGDLKLLTGAMDKLDARSFQYMVNTTITSINYKSLPRIATSITRRAGVYAWTAIELMTRYSHAREPNPIRVPYPEVAPYLREAVAIAEAAGIAVTVRYAPLCLVAGMEKNHVGIVGVRHDPHEWGNQINHMADPTKTSLAQHRAMGARLPMTAMQPALGAALFQAHGQIDDVAIGAIRGHPQAAAAVFPASPCTRCSALQTCDGVDAQYIKDRGAKDFVPYVSPETLSGPIHPDRLAYRPAFFQKLRADGDIKRAIHRSFFPQPIGGHPRVSIVVPNYNKRKYLRQCLDSVAAQTWGAAVGVAGAWRYGRPGNEVAKWMAFCSPGFSAEKPTKLPEWAVGVDRDGNPTTGIVGRAPEASIAGGLELIIVDDASTDDSREIIQAWMTDHPTVSARLICCETNAGCEAVVRNQGIREATGEIVVCLDSDDWIAPTYIEEAVRTFQAHPEASIVHPSSTFWDETGTKVVRMLYAAKTDLTQILQGCTIVCASAWRRSMWEEIGGYDESKDVRGTEDWALWIRALGLGHVAVPLQRALFNYRVTSDGVFESKVRAVHDEKVRQIIMRNAPLYSMEVVDKTFR